MNMLCFCIHLGLLSLWWGGGSSLIAQTLMNPPAMRETWVRSLVGKIPVFWPGEFGGLYSPWGQKESDMTEQLSLFLSEFCVFSAYRAYTYFLAVYFCVSFGGGAILKSLIYFWQCWVFVAAQTFL